MFCMFQSYTSFVFFIPKYFIYAIIIGSLKVLIWLFTTGIQKYIDFFFCPLIDIHPTILLNSVISSRSFLSRPLRITTEMTKSSAKTVFNSFLSTLDAFNWFFLPYYMAWISTIMLNKSGRSGHLWFFSLYYGNIQDLTIKYSVIFVFYGCPLAGWWSFLLFLVCWKFLSEREDGLPK